MNRAHLPNQSLAFATSWKRLGLLLLPALAVNGCVQLPTSEPKAEVKALQRKSDKPGSVTPTTLQASVMRFADEYAMTIAQAADDFSAALGTLQARHTAARIKLGQATAAIMDATGQSPTVNALDLVVLATVSRMVAEDYLAGQAFGEAALPLVQASRRLETNAWTLVKPVLKPEQQGEVHELIREWRLRNPNQRYVGAARFREFAEALGKSPQIITPKPTSVFSLLFLDPMAGLDPTVRAVEETRYLAERAMYYIQRMPILVSWQAEFLALQLADQPAAKQVLTSAERLTKSAESFAVAAGQLPKLVNDQREAAIEQLLAGVASERSNILASLASEEKKMRELLAETRGTLNAGSEMAASVKGAIQSLDAFVRYVTPPKTNAPTVNTNQRPFNVLDYGTAATQVAVMAKEVNALLTSVNQTTPQVVELGRRATADAQRVVHRAFWLGVVLILILLVGSVVAALAYRVLAAKLACRAQGPDRRTPSP